MVVTDLLTETVLYYWDCIDYLYHQRAQVAKGDWAGIGEVQDWAGKLALSETLHTRSISSSHTGSKGSHASHGSHFKPAISGTCPSTLGNTSTPQESESDFNLYIHGDDQAEHNAMSNPTLKAVKRTDTMARYFFHMIYHP